MIMYVDDSDIFINSTCTNQIEDIKIKSQHAITFWKEALHVTGGVVRPSKCSWVLVDFAWNGSQYRYKDKMDLPGDIFLEDETRTRRALKRNNPSVALEGLGVYLQPKGNDDQQYSYMMESIQKWKAQLLHSTLPPSFNFNAMHTRIIRTLYYPLPTICLTSEQCKSLEASIYRESLPRCGISSKLPLIMRYGSRKYMGLAIPEFEIQQGLSHTRELLTSFDTNTTTAEQFKISLELIHLLVGTSDWIFDKFDVSFTDYIDNSWMRTTWNFLVKHQFQIHAPHITLRASRQNDCFLMDGINSLQISIMGKVRLNRCRVYLQALTISDIVDAAGINILESAMRGRKDMTRTSNLLWPNQGRPCENDWH